MMRRYPKVRDNSRMHANPATFIERATAVTDADQIAIDELTDALEERFGGVIQRDAGKIARFVVLRQKHGVA